MLKSSYYKTNISGIGSLKSNFDYETYYATRKTTILGKDIFNDEWIAIFNSFGLQFRSGYIFFLPSNWTFPSAHSDHNLMNHEDNDVFALNWMVYGEKSEMIWYKPNAEPTLVTTRFGSIMATWDYKDLEEIDRTVVDDQNYMLVRTDIPHTVYTTIDPRLVISVRFHKTPSWDEQVYDLERRGIISF